MKKKAAPFQPVYDPETIIIIEPSVIAKARATLDAFVLAHAEYERDLEMFRLLSRANRQSHRFEQSEIGEELEASKFTLSSAFAPLMDVLDGVIQTVRKKQVENRFMTEARPVVMQAAKHVEDCLTALNPWANEEIPPSEFREGLIVGASIALALLETTCSTRESARTRRTAKS